MTDGENLLLVNLVELMQRMAKDNSRSLVMVEKANKQCDRLRRKLERADNVRRNLVGSALAGN